MKTRSPAAAEVVQAYIQLEREWYEVSLRSREEAAQAGLHSNGPD